MRKMVGFVITQYILTKEIFGDIFINEKMSTMVGFVITQYILTKEMFGDIFINEILHISSEIFFDWLNRKKTLKT
jgi:hypothetical protein